MAIRWASERDQEQWNQFIKSSPEGSFLQSWEWGDAQYEFGARCWRLIDEGRGGIQAAALVLRRDAPGGRQWLYVPRGPVLGKSKIQNPNANMTSGVASRGSDLMRRIVELAQKEKAMFVRADPLVEDSAYLGAGWRKSRWEIQPQHTLVVDMDAPEEDLLAAMHQKTRYNIRLAQRRQVSTRFSTDAEDVALFWRLAQDVRARASFHYHPQQYYEALRRALAPSGMFEIGVAEHAGSVLAVHLLVGFGETMTYVHGASASDKRELMAPHLLQWESMRRAKRAGFRQYDFFGVAPAEAGPKHSWAGITRFKEGFGGRRVSYIGAYDYVLAPVHYGLYAAAKRVREVLSAVR